MRKRTRIASAGATVALLVATGMYVDALSAGHTDGGLKVDPGGSKSAAPHRTRGGTPPSGTERPGADTSGASTATAPSR